jgi:VIT1/CCC1 family predicted Fe2+/Mn2+ transporter
MALSCGRISDIGVRWMKDTEALAACLNFICGFVGALFFILAIAKAHTSLEYSAIVALFWFGIKFKG